MFLCQPGVNKGAWHKKEHKENLQYTKAQDVNIYKCKTMSGLPYKHGWVTTAAVMAE